MTGVEPLDPVCLQQDSHVSSRRKESGEISYSGAKKLVGARSYAWASRDELPVTVF